MTSKRDILAARRAGSIIAHWLPADPALWLQQCAVTGIEVVALGDDSLGFIYDQQGPDRERAEFLEAWINDTKGGKAAVLELLRKKG